MFTNRIYNAVSKAIRPAFRTIFWILKLMLPITLLVSCLNYVGVIQWLSDLLAPLFIFIGLSGEAVIVFITSILLNIYSAIAVIATLGFDFRSVTILSVMCLIAHNLIIESAVQKKTGAPAIRMAVLRIGTALLAGALLNLILPAGMEGRLMFTDITSTGNPSSWGGVFTGWLISMGKLTLRMVVFIVGLNILQNILKEFHVIDILIYPLKPLMKIFGLPESTSFLWIVANCVGLAYGGALMIEEVEKGEIAHNDALLLNTHIAISHSLLEDTLLFAAIGVGVFWLIVPRLLLAVVAVWIQRFAMRGQITSATLGTITKNR